MQKILGVNKHKSKDKHLSLITCVVRKIHFHSHNSYTKRIYYCDLDIDWVTNE